MDLGDLILRFVRGGGALVGAAAGIAALLTEGAFPKRVQPLGGWRGYTPLTRYEVTPWGMTLLAVIVLAPTIQFVGDWIKDSNDDKTLRDTAAGIRQDVKSTVTSTTQQARQEIVDTVRSETQKALQPFGIPEVEVDASIACDRPAVTKFCKSAIAEGKRWFKRGNGDTGVFGFPVDWSLWPKEKEVPYILMHIYKDPVDVENLLSRGCADYYARRLPLSSCSPDTAAQIFVYIPGDPGYWPWARRPPPVPAAQSQFTMHIPGEIDIPGLDNVTVDYRAEPDHLYFKNSGTGKVTY